MLHTTRTNLLRLKEKRRSVEGSVHILKARRQGLIQEFLDSSRQFLLARNQIRNDYRRAREELGLARALEGDGLIASVRALCARPVRLDLCRRNLLGVIYHEVSLETPIIRSAKERGFGRLDTTPHLDESVELFETITEAILEIAVYESKLKRIGEEIARVTRRTRVLEERILPKLAAEIRFISSYLSERERETYFRLKRFKELHGAG